VRWVSVSSPKLQVIGHKEMGEVAESPPLEGFKRYVDVALWNMV